MGIKFPHYAHQQLEFDTHRTDLARALLWQPRTGKSKAMIDLSCDRILNDGIVSVLCLAPNLVHFNWCFREIPSHKWDNVELNTAYWSSKSKKIEKEINVLLDDPTPFWLSLNSEALMLDRVLKIIKKLLKRGPAILIVDESHDFRTPGSKRTKRLRALSKHFKYRRILTGTPIDNTPFAAYSQFELLEPGALGQTKYSDFKDLYGEFAMQRIGNRMISKCIAYRNLDLLHEKIAKWSSVVGREGMAPFTKIARDFEMLPEQKKIYETLKKEFLVELEGGGEITAVEGGARMIKLQQILSGFVIDSEKVAHQIMPPEKNPRLAMLIEELREEPVKTIIWCKFKEDIRIIAEALVWQGITCVEYHGSIKTEQRNKAIESFMNDPKCMVFLGQPKAGGTGLNLSSAEKVIWYSHTFDAIERGQASERATEYKGRSITLVDYGAMDSVDQYIMEMHRKKKKVVDLVMIKEHLK